MKSEVTIHSQESINFLLCGTLPIVTNKRPVVKTRSIKNQEPQFDMSGFPEPITGFKKRRPRTQNDAVRRINKSEGLSTSKYSKIRTEKTFMKTVEANLSTYKDNHKRKVAQIHQDWEERYVQPFNERMKNQLNGERYSSFKNTRSRAITALGPSTCYSTLSADIPVEVPTVKVSTSGLSDKVHNFTKHVKKERELTREVCGTDGVRRLPKDVRPAEEALAQLKETRFYGENTKAGRKYFPSVLKSEVYDEIHNID